MSCGAIFSCKLPFGYHHLRVQRFVSRAPQHFCSIVEYWFLDLVTWILVLASGSRGLCAFRAVRALKRACHAWWPFPSNSVYAWSESSRSPVDNRNFRKSWFMLSSTFLNPSQSGLLIARTANKKDHFQIRKLAFISMIWRHLQQTPRVDQTCYWGRWRLWSSAARCTFLATADQLDQFPQDPVLPLQTFRRH